MREWIKRWLNTRQQFEPTMLFEKLQQAQSEHISDLRVLIDKGHEREAVLAGIVREAVSKPQIVPAKDRRENPVTLPVSSDHLSDVEVFDEEADTAEVARQRDLENELRALYAEQTEEGITKP